MKRYKFAACLLIGAIIITMLPYFAFAAPENLNEHLVGYYAFDEDMDNAKGGSADPLGSTINAAAENPTLLAESNNGQGVVFDGSNGLRLDARFSETTNTYSAAYWIKAEDLTSYTTTLFLSASVGDSDARWVSVVPYIADSNSARLWSRDATQNFWGDINFDSPALSEWVHYAVVVDGGTATMYVNGEEAVTSNQIAGIVGESTELYLGVNAWDTPFKGMMDEVYLYDIALTQAQVQHIMRGEEAEVARKAGLEDAIESAENKANALLSNDYLTGSVEVYKSQIEKAKVVLDNSNVTKAEISEAIDMLSSLDSVLLEKEELTDLELSEDLIAHYPLANSALDYSGNGNDGTLNGNGGVYQYGYLTLPGGASGSDAAYMQMPTGMFDNQNTLTISVWLQNESFVSNSSSDSPNNYSALYFGQGKTGSYPRQYWLLNPKNPRGVLKSVITDSDSSSPWSTEVGAGATNSPADGPETSSEWSLYTTVIEPGKLSVYYNDQFYKSYTTTKNVSDFGTDLLAYIGRSAYDDKFYEGSVRDLRIYGKTLDSSQVAQLYSQLPKWVEEENLYKLQSAADALDLGELSAIRENIILPSNGLYDTVISWESSAPLVVSDTGTVTRPEDTDTAVTLTATLTLNGVSLTKTFSATVLAGNAQKDLEDAAAEFELLTKVVYEDIQLPSSGLYGTAISWASQNTDVLSSSGKIINRPAVGSGDSFEVTLKATFSIDGLTMEKNFTVAVKEAFYGYVLSYTNTAVTNNDRTGALHIAYSEDGSSWTALNSDIGVLYADIGQKYVNSGDLNSRYSFESPYLFRKQDGSFGFAATQRKGNTAIYVYDSTNLAVYKERDMLEISGGAEVKSVEVAFDYENQAYSIIWSDGGNYYSSSTKDFIQAASAVSVSDPQTETPASTGLSANAAAGNVIGVTKAEYDYLVQKLGKVYNTGVEDIGDVTVQAGSGAESLNLPESVTLTYSDNGTYNLPVSWNTDNLNLNEAGTYTITGEVVQEQYENPFIEERADPQIYYDEDNDNYLFTASYPSPHGYGNGYDRITLRQSDTIAGLADAEEITIWNIPDNTGAHTAHIWAPEIHKINGKYYIFFAGGSKNSRWDIHPYVLACNDSSDPTNPDSWDPVPKACTTEFPDIYFRQNVMGLDMTYFEYNNEHYVIWAEKVIYSDLYIGKIDPDQPWKIIGDITMLTYPEFGWERESHLVDEGPTVLFTKDAYGNDERLYLAYSGSGTGPAYCIGMLYIDLSDDVDFLDIDNWTKINYPVLTSAHVDGEYGPGHNSFTVDEYGNAVFVYHARSQECYDGNCVYQQANKSVDPLYDPCRHARLKRVHYSGVDGTPILNMTYEEELADEFKTVSMTVIVTKEDENITDKSGLKQKLSEGYALDVSPYTDESAAKLIDALNAGQAVYDDPDASQEKIDAAVEAIQTAIDNLILKDDVSDPDPGSGTGSETSSDSSGDVSSDSEISDDGTSSQAGETSSDSNPKTGDQGMWLLMILFLEGSCVIFILKRKNRSF